MAKGKFSALRAFLGGGGVEIERAIVAGALANTNIAVAGLAANAQLLSVVFFNAGVPTDETANASIPAAGELKVSVDTSAGKLDVIYAQHA